VKMLKIIFLMLFVSLYADGQTSVYAQPYKESTVPHLYEKFDYSSDIESMECDSMRSPSKCSFKKSYGAHLGTILLILFVAFLLMSGLIGRNPDYDGIDYSGGY